LGGGGGGLDLSLGGGAGGISSSSYEASSSYSTTGGANGYAGGLETSFGGLGFASNANDVALGSSSYESY